MEMLTWLIIVMQVIATNPSICDKYTKSVFKKIDQSSQLKLLTLLVNTVVIGNFTPTVNNKFVSGILGPQEFMGQKFDLTGFFTGTQVDVNGGKTANINGKATAGINFLDGGGAEALKTGKASNLAGSRQEKLLLHLYQLFGELTGCSTQGGKIFPKYSGNPSMTDTHKFMGLNTAKLSFFNDMVVQAAEGLGVEKKDAQAIGKLLESTFNIQCEVPTKLTPELCPEPQGSCTAKDCRKGKDKKCLEKLKEEKSNPNLPPPCTVSTTTTTTQSKSSTLNTETIKQAYTTVTLGVTQPTDYPTTTSDTSITTTLSYPTASPQFDLTSAAGPYASNPAILSSGMKLDLSRAISMIAMMLF